MTDDASADQNRSDEFGMRYLKKLRSLSCQAHLARMNDLLARIRDRLPELEGLLEEIEDHWGEEDGIYRFYHQSFKVFRLQDLIKRGVKLIEEIGGDIDPPQEWYCLIVKEGTAHDFGPDTNANWLEATRPILEAFWHTKYFLTMMIKYAKELESVQSPIPSGWAAVLYLFELR
jgi:hypothetical protein